MCVNLVDMNERLKEKIEESCIKRNFLYEYINSGVGYDSLFMVEVVDIIMIFVLSKVGRSYC